MQGVMQSFIVVCTQVKAYMWIKKWGKRVKDCDFVGERIISMKLPSIKEDSYRNMSLCSRRREGRGNNFVLPNIGKHNEL